MPLERSKPSRIVARGDQVQECDSREEIAVAQPIEHMIAAITR